MRESAGSSKKKKKKDELKGKITCLELMARCLKETKSSWFGEHGEKNVKNVLWLRQKFT